MHGKTLVFMVCGFIFLPHFIFASPVINGVLFDPVGTDTGLEEIVLYNSGASGIDLSGWELYPDGVGYFTFPDGFTLAGQSSLVIHLRTSGSNDAGNLYHAAASANMGNSSGSVALFRPGGRNKDTLADFVRYHKPGSSEAKTWESSAVDAGLWVAGEFVDVTNLSEGSAIVLATPGLRGNAASWRISSSAASPPPAGGSSPSPQATPTGTGTPPSSSTATPQSSYGSSGQSKSSLGADAGPDSTAPAGSNVSFLGAAFGFDGEPLPTARFLWNFGDGVMQEGRSLIHVYQFPGTYHANLIVSSGEYSGSDWRTLKIVPLALVVSEVKPGGDGFVEVINASPETIDISGINISDRDRHTFYFPPRTLIGPKNALVFANTITGLDPKQSLLLRDARMAVLEEVTLPQEPLIGESWQRQGERFIAQSKATPGVYEPSVTSDSEKTSSPLASPVSSGQVGSPENTNPKVKVIGEASTVSRALGNAEIPIALSEEPTTASTKDELAGTAFLPQRSSFVFFAFGGSALGAILFFVMKRKLIPGGST